MPEKFDPYYKWLGIQPKDQPPNHYRLLGVEPYERDPEVIDAAANRLMEYLQSVAVGQHLGAAQALMNEVSAARLCLLDPKKKTDYDKGLRNQQSPERAHPTREVRGTKRREPTPPPPPPAPLIVPPPVARGGSHGQAKASRKKGPELGLLIGLGVFLVIVGGAAIYLLILNPSRSDEAKSPANSRANTGEAKSKVQSAPRDTRASKNSLPDRVEPADGNSEPMPFPDPPKEDNPPKKEKEKPSEPPPDPAEVMKAALEALDKKDLKKADELLQRYVEIPDAPERAKASDLLSKLRSVTSDELALAQLEKFTEDQLRALEQGSLKFTNLDPPLSDIALETLKKNLPEYKRRKEMKPKEGANDKSPSKESTGKDPAKKDPPTEPEPEPMPVGDPEQFLAAKGLKKRVSAWLLDEDPLLARLGTTADLERKYQAASAKAADAIADINKLKQQFYAVEKKVESYTSRKAKPPPQVAQQFNELQPKVGNDQAVGGNESLRNSIRAKISARNELAVLVLSLRQELGTMEETYRRLADHKQVAEALGKLPGGTQNHLGPSSKFKAARDKFAKTEALVMTDEVPLYLQGPDTVISTVLNDRFAVDFVGRAAQQLHTIPEAIVKKAGIPLDPAAPTSSLSYNAGDGKKKQITCKELKADIRVGRHVLKDVKFFVTPPEGSDMGASLGGSVWGDYQVEADRDNFVFKIRAPGDPGEKKKARPKTKPMVK